MSPLPCRLLSLAEDGIAGGDMGYLGSFTPCSRLSPVCAGSTRAAKPQIISEVHVNVSFQGILAENPEGGEIVFPLRQQQSLT